MGKIDRTFRQAFHKAFRRIKKEEHIHPDEINASWKEIEAVFSATTTPRIIRKKRFGQPVFIIGSVAASILIVIALSIWQGTPTSDTVPQLHHLIVPEGKNRQLILSDGSIMDIKANSHVIYPDIFSGAYREITLVEGEIYMDVTHDPEVPFIVKTEDFQVKVLGTQFNVSTPKKTKPAAVILVEGSVEVENSQTGKALLRPNQLAKIYPGQIHVENVDVFKYICWKDRVILLDGDRLGTILEELSSFYGVTVRCSDDIAGFALSGKLDLNDSVEKTIRVLKLSTGFEYEKTEDGFYIYNK